MQCVKCARGYKAVNNVCTKCEACTCNKNQIIVRGICIPKNYVNARPKYEEGSLHPLALLDVVKHEYLCMVRITFFATYTQQSLTQHHYPSSTWWALTKPLLSIRPVLCLCQFLLYLAIHIHPIPTSHPWHPEILLTKLSRVAKCPPKRYRNRLSYLWSEFNHVIKHRIQEILERNQHFMNIFVIQ